MIEEEEIKKAGRLSDLEGLVSACKRCPLYLTKNKDVLGSGSEKAEIFFIGEAPGREEDLRGEPFVGPAGRLLGEMLEEIGLERKDVFIANILKHRPPNNRDPQPEEVEACWPYLLRQIEIIKPKLIVFLGRHALGRFFPGLKISEVHGRKFSKKWQGTDRAFLALYHPAAALYNGSMVAVLKDDFQKIPEFLREVEVRAEPKQGRLL